MKMEHELYSDDPSDGEWIDTTDNESESSDEWHTSDEDFINDSEEESDYEDWEVNPVVLNVNVQLPSARRPS
tara:strand:- start:1109 stop:1324 length:216 start_codon:yes stop_codon:yes gene_type:complete